MSGTLAGDTLVTVTHGAYASWVYEGKAHCEKTEANDPMKVQFCHISTVKIVKQGHGRESDWIQRSAKPFFKRSCFQMRRYFELRYKQGRSCGYLGRIVSDRTNSKGKSHM